MNSNQLILEALINIEGITGKQVKVYLLDDSCITASGAVKNTAARKLFDKLPPVDEVQVVDGKAYLEVFDGTRVAGILESNTDEASIVALKFAEVLLAQILNKSQDRQGRENFIKNLLLDNLLLVDIYNRAKQLHIPTRVRRVAFLIEVDNMEDNGVYSVLKSMFGGEESDFIVTIDESDIAYIKELKENETTDDLIQIAHTIVDMLNTEVLANVRVSIGTVAEEIRKVAGSYKEAKLALAVGKIFKSEEKVVAYSTLGIGRLIYQLPIPMCKMFIDEIFKEESPDDFDSETLETISAFFENNLNISETSRKLFIHRNTLVYRLDKLQKNTGLDLRVFDDAITFQIALMVVKYMRYMDKQE